MARVKHDAEMLYFQVRALHLPLPEREYQFHAVRKWRFDFAWPEQKIAAEFEGGVFIKGRHTRGTGFEGDCEKYNRATLMGWRVFRFTAKNVKSGEAARLLEVVLNGG